MTLTYHFIAFWYVATMSSRRLVLALTQSAGGYPKFVAEGHNKNYLPLWLQKAGYNTYYTGKLMNQHGIKTYNAPYAAGWTRSDCTCSTSLSSQATDKSLVSNAT